jgi:hypothetical protein
MKAGGDKDGIWTILESGLQYVPFLVRPLCISVPFLVSAQSCRMSHTSLIICCPQSQWEEVAR